MSPAFCYSVEEIAARLGVAFTGDPKLKITGFASLRSAQEGQIACFYDIRYKEQLKNTAASALLTTAALAEYCGDLPLLITAQPKVSQAKLASLFVAEPITAPGIHPTAIIDSMASVAQTASIAAHCVVAAGARIEDRVVVGPGCVIGEDVQIGVATVLHPRVTLYAKVNLGQQVIVHSGAVIGCDGFGMAQNEQGWLKIPHLGGVMIGDYVEIGANTTIDRGMVDNTVLATGVKLDNQVHIAHNVTIGAHTVIAACTGIAGSTRIGAHCMIGGGVGIGDHIELADGVIITGMGMVTGSIRTPGVYSSGTGLQPSKLWRRNAVRFRQLDSLASRLQQLEKKL